MANSITIGILVDETIEMAERKGIGHPYTIRDEIKVQISIELCHYYLKEFGAIMPMGIR